MVQKDFDLSLYLVLDGRVCGDRDTLLQTAEIALACGVSFLQLRGDKTGWSKRQWYEIGKEVQSLCRSAKVTFVINDQVDIALALDADGVHIGQKDLPAQVVRRLIGKDKILGLSTSNVTEVKAVDTSIVDYIGMGPVYPTTSKTDAPSAIGLDGLREMVAAKRIPGVAIGGINAERMPDVRAVCPDGIAVVSAICGQANIAKATNALKADTV